MFFGQFAGTQKIGQPAQILIQQRDLPGVVLGIAQQLVGIIIGGSASRGTATMVGGSGSSSSA